MYNSFVPSLQIYTLQMQFNVNLNDLYSYLSWYTSDNIIIPS